MAESFKCSFSLSVVHRRRPWSTIMPENIWPWQCHSFWAWITPAEVGECGRQCPWDSLLPSSPGEGHGGESSNCCKTYNTLLNACSTPTSTSGNPLRWPKNKLFLYSGKKQIVLLNESLLGSLTGAILMLTLKLYMLNKQVLHLKCASLCQ